MTDDKKPAFSKQLVTAHFKDGHESTADPEHGLR